MENLRPAKLGEVRNPKGRPNAGASIKEWINQMQGWPTDRVQSVADDESQPIAKRTAARAWLLAATKDTTTTGQPIAGPYFDRVCDRTDGKPIESVKITNDVRQTTVGAAGIDYSKVTDEDLADIERIAERIAARSGDN